MGIRARCWCGQVMEVPEGWQWDTGRCPACGRDVPIPKPVSTEGAVRIEPRLPDGRFLAHVLAAMPAAGGQVVTPPANGAEDAAPRADAYLSLVWPTFLPHRNSGAYIDGYVAARNVLGDRLDKRLALVTGEHVLEAWCSLTKTRYILNLPLPGEYRLQLRASFFLHRFRKDAALTFLSPLPSPASPRSAVGPRPPEGAAPGSPGTPP